MLNPTNGVRKIRPEHGNGPARPRMRSVFVNFKKYDQKSGTIKTMRRELGNPRIRSKKMRPRFSRIFRSAVKVRWELGNPYSFNLVTNSEVGRPVSRAPPHRSRRADFSHRALQKRSPHARSPMNSCRLEGCSTIWGVEMEKCRSMASNPTQV